MTRPDVVFYYLKKFSGTKCIYFDRDWKKKLVC